MFCKWLSTWILSKIRWDKTQGRETQINGHTAKTDFKVHCVFVEDTVKKVLYIFKLQFLHNNKAKNHSLIATESNLMVVRK